MGGNAGLDRLPGRIAMASLDVAHGAAADGLLASGSAREPHRSRISPPGWNGCR